MFQGDNVIDAPTAAAGTGSRRVPPAVEPYSLSMAEYPLTLAGTKLGELVSRARFGNERVVLTEHGRPVAAIISVEELAELLHAQDTADVALAESLKARGGWVPHELAEQMIEADDAPFDAMSRAIIARTGDEIPLDELTAMWDAIRARLAS